MLRSKKTLKNAGYTSKFSNLFALLLTAVLLLHSCNEPNEIQEELDQITYQVTDPAKLETLKDATAVILSMISDKEVKSEVLNLAVLNYEGSSSATFKHLFQPESRPMDQSKFRLKGSSAFAKLLEVR